MRLLKDGNLTRPFRDALITSGLAMIWGSSVLISDIHEPALWACASVGALAAGLGSVCHLASKAGIRPFDNSYKKARDSYKTKADKQQGQE
jgi:hypothetical protein